MNAPNRSSALRGSGKRKGRSALRGADPVGGGRERMDEMDEMGVVPAKRGTCEREGRERVSARGHGAGSRLDRESGV